MPVVSGTHTTSLPASQYSLAKRHVHGFSMTKSQVPRFGIPQKVPNHALLEAATCRDRLKKHAPAFSFQKSAQPLPGMVDNGVPGTGTYDADPTKFKRREPKGGGTGGLRAVSSISQLPRVLDNSSQFASSEGARQRREAKRLERLSRLSGGGVDDTTRASTSLSHHHHHHQTTTLDDTATAAAAAMMLVDDDGEAFLYDSDANTLRRQRAMFSSTSFLRPDPAPLGPTSYEPWRGRQLGDKLTGGCFAHKRVDDEAYVSQKTQALRRRIAEKNAPTPGPGAYDNPRGYTTQQQGVTFSRSTRHVGDAAYRNLRSIRNVPGPGTYDPYARDPTISMAAATQLASRCPAYVAPENENPDYVFLTSMKDPWVLNQQLNNNNNTN
eukprot:PhM_4_TR14269/c0_g1_i3/m.59745